VLDSKHGGLYYVKENSVRKCRRSDTGFGVDRQVSVAGGYRMHTRRISAAGTRGGRPAYFELTQRQRGAVRGPSLQGHTARGAGQS
jgi:hypothetical protein